ncbi:DNA repair protein RecO [Breznakiella homolactica]|uniref:DNA repair protein RecO n=1 Tax=Breznakiella homolactica TaxID=2798577 RepID=A0A7T7XMP5_9SPIR|nr:DNA repair protein RecO C-terminal domain-containing protein [Breznakiella homolactica]QQO09052.1 DNA repair protein RecO C-terminal domain-containing protein [Breznakiella homolactica]
MSRSVTYEALVLRVRPSGESNREAFFLTPEEGIVRAILYGGPKSKLRSHVAPFHRGTLWIYRDPAKDSRKVSDFDVRSWRPGIREQYERTIAAGALAETILAGHGGGGNWDEALTLADATLDALDTADERGAAILLVQFLWNWANVLGVQPHTDTCASCACECPADELLWYSKQEGAFVCRRCTDHMDPANSGAYLPVNPGVRRWLTVAGSIHPAELHRYTLDTASAAQAKTLVTGILTGALGRRLASWDVR